MVELRVLVIADDPLVRAGLATILSEQSDCLVVGRIAAEGGLAEAVDAHRPDVILWDLGWNPGPGLERLAELGRTLPPIVALLPGEEGASRAWAAGLRGLLIRDTEGPRLALALRAAFDGLVVLDVPLALALAPIAAGPGPSWSDQVGDTLIERLTQRELEVLRLMAEGLPNKTIALRLDISEHTVKFHVNAILAKLGVGSRTEAVVRATRLGLILL